MKPLMFAIAAVAQLVLVANAGAQRSVQLGIAGGATFPVGHTDSLYSAGPNGLITIALGSEDALIGLRLDYQYNGFTGRTIGGVKAADFHTNSVSANLVVPFRVDYAKPYIIGGVGLYPLRNAATGKRENDWGVNGGAGLGFPLPHTNVGGFIEVRYHSVNGPDAKPYHFVPVTLGILF